MIGSTAAGSAAEGRLQAGDRILAMDGQPVRHYDEIGPLLQTLATNGRTIQVRIDRAGTTRVVDIDPKLTGEGDQQRWILGILAAPATANHDALLRFGPVQAIPAALSETRQMASDTPGHALAHGQRQGLAGQHFRPDHHRPGRQRQRRTGRGLVPQLPRDPVAEPVHHEPAAHPSLGWGHLLYYLIELVKGSPVGERALVAGQYVGLVLLAGLMGLAFYNDIFRPSF